MRWFLPVILCVSACGQGTPTENAEVAAAVRIFEAWIEGQIAYRGLPGVAVGVVSDQQLVWSRGFGFADLDTKAAITPRTKFRMASNTKMFTAVSVLQLRDAGRLRLDDPVSKHLPWFRLKPASEDDPPVTLEHLLTHGSGLPREAAAPYWVSFEFPTVAQIRSTVSGQTAAYSPEVRWKYSNLALALAGQVVETVSGERYTDYVQNHIFKPLGMAASSIDTPVDGLAAGYGRRMPDGSRKRMAFMDCKGLGPAAGLTSNVEDMAKFISLQFRTGRAGGIQILSGPTLREMSRVRFLENDWSRGTGLGFQVRRAKEKLYVGHGGSLAGYKTHTLWVVEDKVGVVVLTNGDDSRPEQIAQRLMDTVGAAVVKAAKLPEKPPLWDPAWRRFAGLYRSIWSDTQVVELKDSLALIDPLSDDPQAGMLRLVPLGGGVFKLEGPTGGDAVGEQVTFVEEAGRVKSIVVGLSASERVL